MLSNTAASFPNEVALASAEFQLTYGALDEEARTLADRLAAVVDRGRRIGVLLPNEAAFPIAVHALFRLGRSALLLNPANSPREIAEQVQDAKVGVVLTTERLRTEIPQGVVAVALSRAGSGEWRVGDPGWTELEERDVRQPEAFSWREQRDVGQANAFPRAEQSGLGESVGLAGAERGDLGDSDELGGAEQSGLGESDGLRKAEQSESDALAGTEQRGLSGTHLFSAAPGDEAVTIFTSAMTGRARGAVLTHRNLVANLLSTVDALDLIPGDRVYAALPFAHAFGLTVCLNAPLAAGATVLPVPRFNPLNALEELTGLGPTVLAGVPAMFIGMIAAAERKGVPSHSLRIALCGGAPLPLEVAHRWEELFGLPLRQGYGLTEASPVCLFNLPHEPNRPGTLGTPFPGVEVSIRDGAGDPLPDGEVGQLCIRGENVFGGYLGDPPGAGPFLGDWLQTGDLASQSANVVRFRGLLKPMFTRNGFNVYPEEIRRVLREDARIEEVFVCARPDLVRENEVVLEVRARPGAVLTEADVRDLCVDRLASYKQPSKIRILR